MFAILDDPAEYDWPEYAMRVLDRVYDDAAVSPSSDQPACRHRAGRGRPARSPPPG